MEAVTIDIAAARQWRIKSEEAIDLQEKKSQNTFLHDSLSWLNVTSQDYESQLDILSCKRQKGTCEWVFRDPKFKTWKDDGHGEPILWVKGIPGAGMD